MVISSPNHQLAAITLNHNRHHHHQTMYNGQLPFHIHDHDHLGEQAGPGDAEAGGRRHRGERQSFCSWETGED